MAAKKFTLTFTSQPTAGNWFTLQINYASSVVLVSFIIYNTFPGGHIGATLAETVANTKAQIDNDIAAAGLTDVTTTIIGNKIEIIAGNNLSTVTGCWYNTISAPETCAQTGSYPFGTVSIADYTFAPSVIELPDAVILARSPYWFNYQPGVAYDRMNLSLYVYRGDKLANVPAEATYNLSKYVVQAGQQRIGFNIAPLVRDFVDFGVRDFLNAGVHSPGFNTTAWAYIEANMLLGDDVVKSVSQYALVLDGYGYHFDGYNPQPSTGVLSSINQHIVFNADYPLYFRTKDLVSLTADGATIALPTFDLNASNRNLAYINLKSYPQKSFVFTYADRVETHTVTRRTECRYTPINCIFKNRFGVWQSIMFNKLSKSDFSRKSEQYNFDISNFGEYYPESHKRRDYLTNTAQKITVNTDFIPEEQNALFKELLLSEMVYLQIDNKQVPVNIASSSWTEKKADVNRLIQYTLEFNISFDELNG